MKKAGAFNRNKYEYYNNSKPQQCSSRRKVSVPKVISGPVRKRRFLAALKIQKVFRGFLVRKSVKRISSIRNEVVKLEQMIINNNNNDEFINRIRDDDKERLRVNETIMSFLLKLDSVRGVDCGVRNFRKSVTKKAIVLQEKLDLIAAQKQSEDDDCSSSNNNHNEYSNNNNNINNTNNNNNNKETILEKLIRDNNDKMMKLMIKQMSEKNDMQTHMINSLTRRVEQLEKKGSCFCKSS